MSRLAEAWKDGYDARGEDEFYLEYHEGEPPSQNPYLGKEDPLIDALRTIARDLRRLSTMYSRLYGENGDRVADLLSQDVYRIGTQLLELIEDADN